MKHGVQHCQQYCVCNLVTRDYDCSDTIQAQAVYNNYGKIAFLQTAVAVGQQVILTN